MYLVRHLFAFLHLLRGLQWARTNLCTRTRRLIRMLAKHRLDRWRRIHGKRRIWAMEDTRGRRRPPRSILISSCVVTPKSLPKPLC